MIEAASLPKRTFGSTGKNVPILGLGTGPSGMGLDDEKAFLLYQHAIDRGVTYIDTAPGYDRAHIQLKPVLKNRRDDVFLASKVYAASETDLRAGLEKGLDDLGVECLDLFYLHSLGSLNWEEITADTGALTGLFKAKEEGLVRSVGFTAHCHPSQCAEAVDRYPFDAVMLAMNFADRYTYGFESAVLPKAIEHGMGVAAMKILGGAAEMEYKVPVPSCFGANGFSRFDLALRYGLALPSVAVAVVGVYSIEELEQLIEWTENAKPLSQDEERFLETEGRRLSEKLGTHFGPME